MALNDQGYRAVGIRIDSGDLAYLSCFARHIFDLVSTRFNIPWFKTVTIVASNDINEETILSLNEQGHKIDCFGIGTHLGKCRLIILLRIGMCEFTFEHCEREWCWHAYFLTSLQLRANGSRLWAACTNWSRSTGKHASSWAKTWKRWQCRAIRMSIVCTAPTAMHWSTWCNGRAKRRRRWASVFCAGTHSRSQSVPTSIRRGSSHCIRYKFRFARLWLQTKTKNDTQFAKNKHFQIHSACRCIGRMVKSAKPYRRSKGSATTWRLHWARYETITSARSTQRRTKWASATNSIGTCTICGWRMRQSVSWPDRYIPSIACKWHLCVMMRWRVTVEAMDFRPWCAWNRHAQNWVNLSFRRSLNGHY